MELSEAVRRRRMVRRFDADRTVPPEVLDAILRNAIRAPSAGFTQGWDFVVLTGSDERAAFWAATTGPDADADSWLAGVQAAPVLVICCADKGAYLRRYAEADKGCTDLDEARWPVPYWDVDTGMAALLMLLTAVDEGLGGLFFGVPATALDNVRVAFAIPRDRRLVGVVSVGYPLPHARSPSLRRGLRGLGQVAHYGRFGNHTAPT